MREVKFRAWNKIGLFMLDWDNFIKYEIDQMKIVGRSYRVFNDNEFELMQYTELLDKDGREVYEGDIVGTYLGEGAIKWLKEYHTWAIEYSDETIFLRKKVKIIGNIYQNSELLKIQP